MPLYAQVNVTIDIAGKSKKISPFLYGRNNSFSSTNPNWTLSSEEFTRIKEANGVKNVKGSWDNSQNKEYLFTRVNQWLVKYFGVDHTIRLGLTELGFNNQNASVTAVTYASILGEFMKHEVELCTPWSWEHGMWETLHLFTRYSKSNLLQSTSSNETLVSVYPSINAARDSLSLILVNRSPDTHQNVTIDLSKFTTTTNKVNRFIIKNLPASETFFSESRNALTTSESTMTNRLLEVRLEPMSVSAVAFQGNVEGSVWAKDKYITNQIELFPNPVIISNKIYVRSHHSKEDQAELIDLNGRVRSSLHDVTHGSIQLPDGLSTGIYMLRIYVNGSVVHRRIVIQTPVD